MAGLWGTPQEPGESDQEWFERLTRNLVERDGTRAIVIANAEDLGKYGDRGAAENYGMLVDSAVAAVLGRGFACGLEGSLRSWASLSQMPNGPLEYSYELVLLPRQREPGARFLREMGSTFDMWRGGGDANGGLDEPLALPIAMEVWRSASGDKDLCLELIEALVQTYEFRGAAAVDLEGCLAWIRTGCRIGWGTGSRAVKSLATDAT